MDGKKKVQRRREHKLGLGRPPKDYIKEKIERSWHELAQDQIVNSYIQGKNYVLEWI